MTPVPDTRSRVVLDSETAFKLVAWEGSGRPESGTWNGKPSRVWLPELVAELQS